MKKVKFHLFKKDQEQDPDYASYDYPVLSKEVVGSGIFSDCMVEEYPHIYSFPLFNQRFCDFMIEAADSHIPVGECSIRLSDIHSNLEDIIGGKIMPKINEMANQMFCSFEFSSVGECTLLRLSPDEQSEYKIGVGDNDYTLFVSLDNITEGGSLYFPKHGTARFRAVDPPIGGAAFFPSVFEHGVNPVVCGVQYSLVIPLII